MIAFNHPPAELGTLAGRADLVPFFRWTLVTRCVAAFFVFGFVLVGWISPVIILFWLGDLAGALWTFIALRQAGLLQEKWVSCTLKNGKTRSHS